MGNRRPLLRDEVSPGLRELFDFDGQRTFLKKHGYESHILHTCGMCERRKWTLVRALRNWIKNGKYEGKCGTCRKTGPDSPHWKGGRYMQPDGYVRCSPGLFLDKERDIINSMMIGSTSGSSYILEHRAVLAIAMGRALNSWEHVHHINGDRSDNLLENLRLVHTGHSAGVMPADVPHCPTCACHSR